MKSFNIIWFNSNTKSFKNFVEFTFQIIYVNWGWYRNNF